MVFSRHCDLFSVLRRMKYWCIIVILHHYPTRLPPFSTFIVRTAVSLALPLSHAHNFQLEKTSHTKIAYLYIHYYIAQPHKSIIYTLYTYLISYFRSLSGFNSGWMRANSVHFIHPSPICRPMTHRGERRKKFSIHRLFVYCHFIEYSIANKNESSWMCLSIST